jgi:hypothetical protein
MKEMSFDSLGFWLVLALSLPISFALLCLTVLLWGALRRRKYPLDYYTHFSERDDRNRPPDIKTGGEVRE